ncbi:DNA replication factor Dna2-domain-containing protein [Geopyxis carbonaria]|nr:DNA replication factor Dna2-domain-containing protein [Geopyxis carbonaria]
MRQVILRDSWVQSTTVYVGQIVHVIGSFDKHNSCTIDNKHNYIILDPDFLVSATTVADTVDCLRKAVLQERVKVTGETSKPMVYGNILHALFQSAIEAGDFQTPSLLKKLDSILINNIQSLFVLREDIPTAREYVKTKLPQIQDWASRFITNRPNKRAIVTDGSQSSSVVAISKLLDIEEHVWSPLYGLKGNIDATVQATLVEGSKQKIFTVPLELKTGRNASSIPHRAQTMLYTLLLSDRYDIAVTSGLLYYMETGDTIRVSAVRHELRELIIKRNQVSGYITKRDILPDMLRSSHSCGRCYAKNSCFLYHSMLEGGTAETSGAEKTFLEVTKHLTVKHKYFFKHWDTLLTKEEKDSVRFRRELWTMTSSNREAVGRCFGGLIIIPESISISQNNTKINKYSYSFKRKFTNITSTFFDSQINEGEPIVVSDENEHYALAIGYVTKIQQNQITVEVDRRLHNARTRQTGFEENERQIFNGILEIGRNSNSESQLTSQAEVLYRVDKDEFSNGMANIRNNLIQLMSSDTNDTHRRVIVDLEAPRFKPSSTAYELCSQSGLNGDQKDAISKVMSGKCAL